MEEQTTIEMQKEMVLSPAEAEEYRAFKKQKRMEEAKSAIARSEAEGAKRGLTLTELKKLCDGAVRVHAAAVRVYPNFVSPARSFLGSSHVKVDCVVGGLGETTTKVKAYECKQARKLGASEITLVLSPSMMKSGKSGEIKREIKKVVKAAKKAHVKVAAEGEWTVSELKKLARLVSDAGAKFLSTAYFTGAETLKKELADCCMLEITGVKDPIDYKALCSSGVERLGTLSGEEIFSVLMKEAENDLPVVKA